LGHEGSHRTELSTASCIGVVLAQDAKELSLFFLDDPHELDRAELVILTL
jgi:hypothetical protein